MFLSLLDDLFPEIKLDKEKYDELQRAISQKVDDDGLINFNEWNLKVIQLFETQRVRHGIMVLGPSGAGKTKCCQVLMGKNAITFFSLFSIASGGFRRIDDPWYAHGTFEGCH